MNPVECKIGSKIYGDKVRVVGYIPPKVYEKLNEERKKTGESESGLISSILSCFVKEICEQ
jgi:hypothetical protein